MNLIITEKNENDPNKIVSGSSVPTICLNMIVKNESKIIFRLFESVLKIIDCYCICDTGSTDNTVQMITDYFLEKGVPGKVVFEPFINFAHNRNFALTSCINMSDYILMLDADMVLEVRNFNKSFIDILTMDSFNILQGNESFFYQNKRIIKNNGQYNYMGVTHEYINCCSPNEKTCLLKKDQLFISDIGDGGAKDDKFERDIRLLKKGIEDEPTNERYYFYLANTYIDSNHLDESIETYKKRIERGGWNQEVWYSYYKIGIAYQRLGQIEKAIYYWLAGYDYFPDRIENLYEIVKYYRETGKQKLSYEFYKIAKNILDKNLDWSSYLFLHNDVYTYKLEYEYAIIAYYLPVPKNINSQAVKTLCRCNDSTTIQNLLQNMKFYKDVLVPLEHIDMSFSMQYLVNGHMDTFYSSSNCIIPNNYGTGYDMNVRLVNYKIGEQGNYSWTKNIISLNKYYALNTGFRVMSEKVFDIEYVDRQYVGIEDIRIFRDTNKKLIFNGTGFHSNDKIGIVTGQYITEKSDALVPCEIKQSFKKSDCEKNWVFVPYKNSTHVIYEWNPCTICKIEDKIEDKDKEITVVFKHDMPNLFKHVRGSTNGHAYKNEIWFVNHIVSYESPRHYYHIFSVFDENMKLLRYSAPFKFSVEPIEYCLSLIVENNRVICGYSTWDRTTNISVFDKKYIDSKICFV